jgi:hypothetical protein
VLNSVSATAENVSDSAIGGGGKAQLTRQAMILSKLPPWTNTVLVLLPFDGPASSARRCLDLPLKQGWRRSTAAIMELAFLSHEGNEARDTIDCLSCAADQYRSLNFFTCADTGTRGQQDVLVE